MDKQHIPCKNPKRNSDTLRALLLASLDSGYLEGCAQSLHACGQTVRNHVKLDSQSLLQVNKKVIQEINGEIVLSKPSTVTHKPS
jgi:hypothetical protein